MPRKKKTTAPVAAPEKKVEAPVVETVKVEEAAPVVEAPKAEAAEKKAPAKKAAAPKKAAEKKPVEKKAAAPAKKVEPKTAVYFQYAGAELTPEELIKKAKKESGVKSPKQIDVYVKPEENMVYYVVDGKPGGFEIVK